jgi:hypothetical protein
MGNKESAPDKNLLPIQAGTLAEGMSSLHKVWESLPFGWFF